MSERQSCSTWMWDESKDLWDAIRAHPFITELEAGTLPDSKLKFYFEQNIQYIDAVYKTRLVAASKTDDRQTFDLLTRDWSLEPSVDRQPRLLGLFGGDADRLPPMAPACHGYTSHMWMNAVMGDTVDWLASFIACPWTYDLIGTDIAERLPDERLQDWFWWYGSDEHHELLAQLRGSLDRLGEDLDAPRRAKLLDKWRTGLRYEWMFWDDAYYERSWPV